MSIATHHDEEAENQWGEVNSLIKWKDILFGIALGHCPAHERWFRKSSAFSEKSSRALLRNFNYTLKTASFIFKTAWQ